jgi:hypothetical protein
VTADVDDSDEEGGAFRKLLGAFGSHADVKRRQRAENIASMHPNDTRRKTAVRTKQFNPRISERAIERMRALIAKFSDRDGRRWSQADLIEYALAELAKAHLHY